MDETCEIPFASARTWQPRLNSATQFATVAYEGKLRLTPFLFIWHLSLSKRNDSLHELFIWNEAHFV